MVGVTRGGVHTHTQPPTPKPYKLNPARSHHNSAPRRAEGGRPDATKKKTTGYPELEPKWLLGIIGIIYPRVDWAIVKKTDDNQI